MRAPCHFIGEGDTKEQVGKSSKNGQFLLLGVELAEHSKLAVDESIHVAWREQLEAVLQLAGEEVAGPPHLGKKYWEVGFVKIAELQEG